MKDVIEIRVWEKSPGDWRSQLEWEDEYFMRYGIRGYGDTPGKAADNAFAKWQENAVVHSEDNYDTL